MSSRKGKRQNKRSKRSGGNPRFPMQFNKLQLTSATTLVPNELDAVLEFTYSSTINNGAGSSKAIRFTPNAAYDVDPVLGSTSTPGFAEYAALFSNYRVVEYSYVLDIVSKETFPILCIVTNTDSDLGTTGLGSYMGNPYSQSHLLSGSAGGPCRKVFSGRHKVADITGTRAVETADSFGSLTTTVPSDKVFLGIGIDGIGSTLTNGVTYLVKIMMKIRFTGRKSLTA